MDRFEDDYRQDFKMDNKKEEIKLGSERITGSPERKGFYNSERPFEFNGRKGTLNEVRSVEHKVLEQRVSFEGKEYYINKGALDLPIAEKSSFTFGYDRNAYVGKSNADKLIEAGRAEGKFHIRYREEIDMERMEMAREAIDDISRFVGEDCERLQIIDTNIRVHDREFNAGDIYVKLDDKNEVVIYPLDTNFRNDSAYAAIDISKGRSESEEERKFLVFAKVDGYSLREQLQDSREDEKNHDRVKHMQMESYVRSVFKEYEADPRVQSVQVLTINAKETGDYTKNFVGTMQINLTDGRELNGTFYNTRGNIAMYVGKDQLDGEHELHMRMAPDKHGESLMDKIDEYDNGKYQTMLDMMRPW